MLQLLKDYSPPENEQKDYLANLGDIHMQLKQYPEATEAFEDLVGIYPDVIDFRLALGKSYLKLPILCRQ